MHINHIRIRGKCMSGSHQAKPNNKEVKVSMYQHHTGCYFIGSAGEAGVKEAPIINTAQQVIDELQKIPASISQLHIYKTLTFFTCQELVNIFSATPESISSLCFAHVDLNVFTHTELIKIFNSIPKTVEVLKLYDSGLHKIHDNLNLIIAALPVGIKKLILDGGSNKPVYTVNQLISIFSSLPDTIINLDISAIECHGLDLAITKDSFIKAFSFLGKTQVKSLTLMGCTGGTFYKEILCELLPTLKLGFGQLCRLRKLI